MHPLIATLSGSTKRVEGSFSDLVRKVAVGTEDVPAAILWAANVIDSYFQDKRALQRLPLQHLQIVENLDPEHPERPVSGMYDTPTCTILLRENVALRLFSGAVFMHEIGHHFTDMFLSLQDVADAGVDQSIVRDLKNAYTDEYTRNRARAEKIIGEKIGDVDAQYRKLWKSGIQTISGYALKNIDEWMAEGWALYFTDQFRLEKDFPATYNAIDSVTRGSIFK